jgi:hypothetical protein
VDTEDNNDLHSDLEESFNAELEVGEAEHDAIDVCPAEKRGPSTTSDEVMRRLATETG